MALLRCRLPSRRTGNPNNASGTQNLLILSMSGVHCMIDFGAQNRFKKTSRIPTAILDSFWHRARHRPNNLGPAIARSSPVTGTLLYQSRAQPHGLVKEKLCQTPCPAKRPLLRRPPERKTRWTRCGPNWRNNENTTRSRARKPSNYWNKRMRNLLRCETRRRRPCRPAPTRHKPRPKRPSV